MKITVVREVSVTYEVTPDWDKDAMEALADEEIEALGCKHGKIIKEDGALIFVEVEL